jgi:hypothetical protein
VNAEHPNFHLTEVIDGDLRLAPCRNRRVTLTQMHALAVHVSCLLDATPGLALADAYADFVGAVLRSPLWSTEPVGQRTGLQ